MILIKRAVLNEHFKQISSLAEVIWREHFTPIIGEKQVLYMLDRFQSYEAIKNAVENKGYSYYMAYDDNILCAYLGVKPEEEKGSLFISKLYVQKSYRGRKISKKLLKHVSEKFSELKKQWLTVNKYNLNTIAAYEKMGFVKTRTQCSDIGGGFVMDDYIMERNL